jgi:hypothetical protein
MVDANKKQAGKNKTKGKKNREGINKFTKKGSSLFHVGKSNFNLPEMR